MSMAQKRSRVRTVLDRPVIGPCELRPMTGFVRWAKNALRDLTHWTNILSTSDAFLFKTPGPGYSFAEKRISFMNAKHLTNYAKDHFAGSVAAVELLDHLISSHRGKTDEQFFIRLRQEIGEDQEVLEELLHDLDGSGGALRNTAAFLSEKLARVKLLLEDPSGGQLARLEKLEALALGIEGKRALWRALLAVVDEIPALRQLDLARLDQRADDQRKRVETRRVEAAREAFVPAKSGG